MAKIKVELWLWMGKELGQDFESLSDMRSEIEIDLEEETTIRELFNRLAERHSAIGNKVFNREGQKFNEGIVITFNERIISPYKIYETKLRGGDKIIVLPVYTGG